MLSLDAFVKRCGEAVEKKEPFIAYRHAHGFGFLYPARAYTAYKVEPHGSYIEQKETKRAQAPKSLVNGFRKEIDKMRKDRHVYDLTVVEFDGTTLTAEGKWTEE